MTDYRIFGLDLYRAAAILLLLLANVLNSFQIAHPGMAQFAPILGLVSLEIFFVLCGFLLGNSFYGIFMAENFAAADAIRFVKRKLLRIVPLYVLVLLANIGIAYLMDYEIGKVWSFFFFLQNFSQPIPAFFPESWGLPVIVFGVLMLVLLMTSLSRIFTQKQKPMVFLMATIGLILVFLWTKWLYHSQHETNEITNWDVTLKTVAIYRFDSVFIGTLFSWIFMQRSAIWEKAKWALLFVGLAGIAFLAFGISILQLPIETHPMFWNIFYLPLTSLILACFLPLLSGWQTAPAFLQRPVSLMSRMAYGIYLVHFSIVLLLAEYLLKVDFGNPSAVILMSAVYVCCSILFGWLLHHFVEKRLLAQAQR
ncbi:acyltransferase family protein [Flavobacterium sp.]|uniref:acyltransferase family protein n=1 Tax=Flavobacterium sp. TaxID=239 RepID=UPI0039E720C5